MSHIVLGVNGEDLHMEDLNSILSKPFLESISSIEKQNRKRLVESNGYKLSQWKRKIERGWWEAGVRLR